MNNFYVKQSDAIQAATSSLYSAKFGATPSCLGESSDFYQLIMEKIRNDVMKKYGILDMNNLSAIARAEAEQLFRYRYKELITHEEDYGKEYLYHPAFFKYFLEKILYSESWGIPFHNYLEINYNPESKYKPRQLDDEEDYKCLAEMISDSLDDPKLEATDYQKRFLRKAYEWFMKCSINISRVLSEQINTDISYQQEAETELVKLEDSQSAIDLIKVNRIESILSTQDQACEIEKVLDETAVLSMGQSLPLNITPVAHNSVTPREDLPIDKVLAIKREILDEILVSVEMIEPDTKLGRYKAKPEVRAWQWVNVRAALLSKLLLAEINDKDAARLFFETYGAIVSQSSMKKRPQNEQNGKNKYKRQIIAYIELCSRLPPRNSFEK